MVRFCTRLVCLCMGFETLRPDFVEAATCTCAGGWIGSVKDRRFVVVDTIDGALDGAALDCCDGGICDGNEELGMFKGVISVTGKTKPGTGLSLRAETGRLLGGSTIFRSGLTFIPVSDGATEVTGDGSGGGLATSPTTFGSETDSAGSARCAGCSVSWDMMGSGSSYTGASAVAMCFAHSFVL